MSLLDEINEGIEKKGGENSANDGGKAQGGKPGHAGIHYHKDFEEFAKTKKRPEGGTTE